MVNTVRIGKNKDLKGTRKCLKYHWATPLKSKMCHVLDDLSTYKCSYSKTGEDPLQELSTSLWAEHLVQGKLEKQINRMFTICGKTKILATIHVKYHIGTGNALCICRATTVLGRPQ